jgi:hypothetical protein
VSPFRPFLLPPPRVCSRNRRLLPSYAPRGANISPILSTLRILPVATGVSGQSAFLTPRPSFTPIFEGSLAIRRSSFVFITLRNPFPATLVFSHPYKTPGVSPASLRPSACPEPGRGGKSHILSGLPPLVFSCRSFSHSLPLFSIACRLFYQNTRGGVSPEISLLESTTSRLFFFALFATQLPRRGRIQVTGSGAKNTLGL